MFKKQLVTSVSAGIAASIFTAAVAYTAVNLAVDFSKVKEEMATEAKTAICNLSGGTTYRQYCQTRSFY